MTVRGSTWRYLKYQIDPESKAEACPDLQDQDVSNAFINAIRVLHGEVYAGIPIEIVSFRRDTNEVIVRTFIE
ncbi:hypothetical protein H4R34_000036 [Dimargaris verticillata]|uniref:Uncharacterized protein n=1 Tax=Dimargaris verticillata TaxID=2761393 RepID=A0A9W8B617_9FUNG|nr:hypothetical protein H4R34_000036 [Dimargaris verticillata]